jgi:hypothetical protein
MERSRIGKLRLMIGGTLFVAKGDVRTHRDLLHEF